MEQIKDAVSFLELCKKIALKKDLTSGMVYSLLEQYNISEVDIKSNDNFQPTDYCGAWQDSLDNKNLDVYEWGNYWFGFDSKYNLLKTKEYIKIYISLDRNHLFNGVKVIGDFLSENNIAHSSKATSIIRTDNVIIRLKYNDYQSLKKIVDFINGNSYLQAGMNKVNPFVPRVGKVGLMHDDGRSYNKELSEIIAGYINNTKSVSHIDFKEFYKYVLDRAGHNKIFIDTFNEAFVNGSRYVNKINGNKKQSDDLSTENYDKNKMFEMAIINTFEKYDKRQAIHAVFYALDNNFSYFSNIGYDENGNELIFRDYLVKNVSSKEVKDIVFGSQRNDGDSKDQIISNYVDSIIYKHKGVYLEEALMATASKYNDDRNDVRIRLREFVTRGNDRVFSRYNDNIRQDYNFREALIKKVFSKDANEVIESILYNMGIQYNHGFNEENIDKLSDSIVSGYGNSKGKKI